MEVLKTLIEGMWKVKCTNVSEIKFVKETLNDMFGFSDPDPVCNMSYPYVGLEDDYFDRIVGYSRAYAESGNTLLFSEFKAMLVSKQEEDTISNVDDIL